MDDIKVTNGREHLISEQGSGDYVPAAIADDLLRALVTAQADIEELVLGRVPVKPLSQTIHEIATTISSATNGRG